MARTIKDDPDTGAKTKGRTDYPILDDETAESWLADPPVSLGGGGTAISLINPDWPCELVRPGATIATQRNQRHARSVHERKTRVYRFTVRTCPPAEWVPIVNILLKARGGGWLRWRHPKDDPAVSDESPIEATPIWRLRDFTLARSRGGVGADVGFELEEV